LLRWIASTLRERSTGDAPSIGAAVGDETALVIRRT
jgi:hypothetical protein